jgi:hypothetical protein
VFQRERKTVSYEMRRGACKILTALLVKQFLVFIPSSITGVHVYLMLYYLSDLRAVEHFSPTVL